MKVRVYDQGEWVEGTLYVSDFPFNAEYMSPFFKMVTDAEHDLLERYRRGELTCEDADSR